MNFKMFNTNFTYSAYDAYTNLREYTRLERQRGVRLAIRSKSMRGRRRRNRGKANNRGVDETVYTHTFI